MLIEDFQLNLLDQKICPTCDNPITYGRPDKIYCGYTCKIAMRKRRQRARLRGQVVPIGAHVQDIGTFPHVPAKGTKPPGLYKGKNQKGKPDYSKVKLTIEERKALKVRISKKSKVRAIREGLIERHRNA